MGKVRSLLKKYNDISPVARATVWYIFCSILQKGIAVLTTPIFTRLMTTEQYGQYSIYLSWIHIFTIITTLRLTGAVFNKGMSKYKDDRDGYTSTMQTVTLLITAAVFIIYLIFRESINSFIELPTFIICAMFAELLVAPAVEFWTIRKRYDYIYRPVVIRTVLMALINTGVGVLAVLSFDEKGYARIISCVIVTFCFGIVLFAYNYRKGKTFLKKEYAVFALTFNLPLLLHYFSQYILDQFDRIMVQKLVSISAAGIYSISYNVGLLLRIVTQSINGGMTPWQYRCLEKGEIRKMDDTMFVVMIVVAGCSLLLSALAPEAMKILADEKYYEGVYVVPPVAMGLFFSFVYTVFANVEFFYDRNRFSMYISVFAALLNIGLNYIGIKLFGYIAAAYTTLLCYIILSLGHYIYLSTVAKKEGIENPFRPLRLVLLSLVLLVFGTVIIFFYDFALVRYAIILAVIVLAVIFRKKIKNALKTLIRQRTENVNASE